MMADSIIINSNSFMYNNCVFFSMNDEKDDKGYYNAEKIVIRHNNFNSQTGTLLNIYRGGNDESTMGPMLDFSNNKISNNSDQPWIYFTGVQRTNVSGNEFLTTATDQLLIVYKDVVRAHHFLSNNILPGKVEQNQFVIARDNR